MRTILIGLVCSLLIQSCAGKKNLLKINHTETPIEIDGELTEWGERGSFFKESIRYGFLMDSTHLYIFIEAKEQNDIMKIVGLGFTFWFNTDGKKKKSMGIRYPIGSFGDEMAGRIRQGGARGQRGADPLMMNELLSQGLDRIGFIGFKVEEEMYTEMALEEFGVQARASFNQNGLFINEIAIPKKLILDGEHSSKLAVGLISDKLEMPSMPAGGGAGRPGGGVGGRPPQGMGGMQFMQEMTQEIKVWTTFDLTGEK